MKHVLTLLAIHAALVGFSQTLKKTLPETQYAFFSQYGNLALVTDEKLIAYDGEYNEIFNKTHPSNTYKVLNAYFKPEEDRIYILYKIKVLESSAEAAVTYSFTDNRISNTDLKNFSSSQKMAYSPDFQFKFNIDQKETNIKFSSTDKVLASVSVDGIIRWIDVNPFIEHSVLAAKKDEIRLINTVSGRYLPIRDIKRFDDEAPVYHSISASKAFYLDEATILLLSHGEIITYNPQDLSDHFLEIDDVMDFKMSPGRNYICVIKDDRTEIYNISRSIKKDNQQVSVEMIAEDLINNLAQKETEVYQKNKNQIDLELNIKSDLFRQKGEFERSDDYEKRLNEGKNYFKGIIEYYSKKELAYQQLDEKIAELTDRHNHMMASMRERVIDSIETEHDKRKMLVMKEKIIKSYQEFVGSISSIGTYDADKEIYPVTVDANKVQLKIPLSVARSFKDDFASYVAVGAKQLGQDGEQEVLLGYKVISPKAEVFESKNYKSPLLLPESQVDPLLKKTISGLENQNNLAVESTRSMVNSQISNAVMGRISSSKFHALIIGVNDYYSETVVDLEQPINDGRMLARVLMDKYSFSSSNITYLDNPTRTDIIEAFDSLSSKLGETDNLLIFYAGHGVWDENLKQGYWLPSDAKSNSKAAWLSNSTIRDYITGIKTKHSLLIADACFSGGIFKTREVFLDDAIGFANLYKLTSRKAMTSGNLTPVQDQSVFIKYLIKKLQENDAPLMSAQQLFMDLKIPVANNNVSGQVPQYGDIMNAGDEGGDFIFVQSNK
ncbi:caspase family protein [Marinoscillum sp. MHG1-6]|uniref:caspase family protein n=1 Tax=Marinoscillum sp. MHG1-6 TaxID=2959627 RepID=UPI00215855C2|nr:caspase family protein [Marinoscillum sp. MHG1-6]